MKPVWPNAVGGRAPGRRNIPGVAASCQPRPRLCSAIRRPPGAVASSDLLRGRSKALAADARYWAASAKRPGGGPEQAGVAGHARQKPGVAVVGQPGPDRRHRIAADSPSSAHIRRSTGSAAGASGELGGGPRDGTEAEGVIELERCRHAPLEGRVQPLRRAPRSSMAPSRMKPGTAVDHRAAGSALELESRRQSSPIRSGRRRGRRAAAHAGSPALWDRSCRNVTAGNGAAGSLAHDLPHRAVEARSFRPRTASSDRVAVTSGLVSDARSYQRVGPRRLAASGATGRRRRSRAAVRPLPGPRRRRHHGAQAAPALRGRAADSHRVVPHPLPSDRSRAASTATAWADSASTLT